MIGKKDFIVIEQKEDKKKKKRRLLAFFLFSVIAAAAIVTPLLVIKYKKSGPIKVSGKNSLTLMVADSVPTHELYKAKGGSGTYTSWLFSPELPTGLEFDSVGHYIYGTPEETLEKTTFTLTVTDNKEQVGTMNIDIDIDDTFEIDGDPTLSYIANEAIPTPELYTAIGGSGTYNSWSISPELPQGLHFNPDNQTIYGTPEVISEESIYVLSVKDSKQRTATLHISLAIIEASTTFFAVGPTVIYGYTDEDILKTYSAFGGTGSGYVYTIEPELPDGLELSAHGELSGIPTSTSAATPYTITVTDSDAETTTLTIIIAIKNSPDTPIYVSGTQILDFNVSQAIVNPIYTAIGGTTETYTWSTIPALPSPLSINVNTGVISGTPSSELRETVYTIVATDGTNVGILDVKLTIINWSTCISIDTTTTVTNNIKYYNDAGGDEQSLPKGINLKTLSGETGIRYFQVDSEITSTIFIPADFTAWIRCDTGCIIKITNAEATRFPFGILVANDKEQQLSLQHPADTHITNTTVQLTSTYNSPEFGINFYNTIRHNSSVNLFNNIVSVNVTINIACSIRFCQAAAGLVYFFNNTISSKTANGKPEGVRFLNGVSSSLTVTNNTISSINTGGGDYGSAFELSGGVSGGDVLVSDNCISCTSPCDQLYALIVSGDFTNNARYYVINNTISASGGGYPRVIQTHGINAGVTVVIKKNFLSGAPTGHQFEGIWISGKVAGSLDVDDNIVSCSGGVIGGYDVRIEGIVTGQANISNNMLYFSCGANSSGAAINFTSNIQTGAQVTINNNTFSMNGYNAFHCINFKSGGIASNTVSCATKSTYTRWYRNSSDVAAIFNGSGNVTAGNFFSTTTNVTNWGEVTYQWTDTLSTKFNFSVNYPVGLEQRPAIIAKLTAFNFTNSISAEVVAALIVLLTPAGN